MISENPTLQHQKKKKYVEIIKPYNTTTDINAIIFWIKVSVYINSGDKYLISHNNHLFLTNSQSQTSFNIIKKEKYELVFLNVILVFKYH